MMTNELIRIAQAASQVDAMQLTVFTTANSILSAHVSPEAVALQAGQACKTVS